MSAAKLQEAVPDAVLVGGSAAAYHAGHRISYDHDHVVAGLRTRYESVFDAVESIGGWTTSPNASKPPDTIMGTLGGFQAGLRNLRRRRPLEVEVVELRSDAALTIPTEEEILRIKAFLVVQRNSVRDYLDTAALASHIGAEQAAKTLRSIDDYYHEHTQTRGSVVTALAHRLADPQPVDTRAVRTFSEYKGVTEQWSSWEHVSGVCRDLARRLV